MSRLHDKLCSSAEYKKRRAIFMFENPGCRLCEEQGITVPAEEMDHIIPLHVDPELALVKSNWQALCRPCHKEKTISENTNIAPSVGMDRWEIKE